MAENEDDDVAGTFFDTLETHIKKIYKQFKFPKRMIFTDADKKDFASASVCHICEKEFAGEDVKVRDHCHLSSKYRGAAHESCNLNYKIPKFFPVVFHNLSGYDSHLFIKKLAGGKINCITNNEEKYISFSREVVVDEFEKGGEHIQVEMELLFIDSFRFMADSLDALSKNLTSDKCNNCETQEKNGRKYRCNECIRVDKECAHKCQDCYSLTLVKAQQNCHNLRKIYKDKQLELLIRKGVYPHDWVDSIAKLDETQLPSNEVFYSRLNNSDISDDDYEHAQTV